MLFRSDKHTQRPSLNWRNKTQSPAKLIWELCGREPVPQGFTVRHNDVVCKEKRCVHFSHHRLCVKPPGRGAQRRSMSTEGESSRGRARPSTFGGGDAPCHWDGTLPHLFALGWLEISREHLIWHHTVNGAGRPTLKWGSRVINPSRLLWELYAQPPVPEGFTVKQNSSVCRERRCVHFGHYFLFRESTGAPCSVNPKRLNIVGADLAAGQHFETALHPGRLDTETENAPAQTSSAEVVLGASKPQSVNRRRQQIADQLQKRRGSLRLR